MLPEIAIEVLGNLYIAAYSSIRPTGLEVHPRPYVPKHLKSARQTANYHPISLTQLSSGSSKKSSTSDFTLTCKPNTLCFRPGYNIYEQLVRVISVIQDNSSRTHPTVLTFLDTRTAFDSVWHNCFRFKIFRCHFPPSIIKWLSQFLDGRTTQVRIRHRFSASLQLNAGIPQGSTISPLLISSIMKTLPSPPHILFYPKAGLAQYSDDTVYWVSAEHTGWPDRDSRR